jgi:multidrug efflux pump subunit AcrB
MNLSNLFYRNPRILLLTISLITVAGLSSFVLLPRLEDPLLAERVATLTTLFPGADAARVESQVTERLEDELLELDEIKEMRATSMPGSSRIILELQDDIYDTDPVWSRVRGRIDDVAPTLPTAAQEPLFEEMYMKAFAVLASLRWTAESDVNYAVLIRLAEQLEDEIRAVPGTELVEVFGEPQEEVVVEIDTAKLAAMNLSVDQIADQIGASDAKRTAGQLRGVANLNVEVSGELDSLDRIGRTPIQFSADGRFVPLSDIASIRKATTDPPTSIVIDKGYPSITLGVLVRSDFRIDQWSRQVVAVIDRFDTNLPPGVELETIFNQNDYVEARLTGLLWNLFIGVLAVSTVVLVMMGWRSAVVVCSALPHSGMLVLTGMRFLEIPIHQMSVTGLIVALGLLIDNAIVIVDEVSVKLRSGMTPAVAVEKSVRHLAIPLFGSTVTTALAFAPIAIMPGPAGEFVGAIAVSVILAIFSSLFLALTVVPALTALGHSASAVRPRVRWWTQGLSIPWLTRGYRASLRFIFRRPAWGVALGVVLPILGFIQAGKLPEQFFPPADRDQLQIEVSLSSQTSLEETKRTVMAMRDLMLQHEEVESLTWFIGESAPSFYYNIVSRKANVPFYAQGMIKVSSPQLTGSLTHQLQRELDETFPQSRTLVRQLEQGPPFDAPVEVRLFGPDLDVLSELGEQVRAVLAATPHVIHTRSDSGEGVPKVALRIDEEEARLAGLDYQTIATQMNSALEGSIGGSIIEGTEELPVRVRVANSDRQHLAAIASTNLLPTPLNSPAAASGGALSNGQFSGVPLSALGDLTLVAEPSSINHINGLRVNEIQAFITSGVLPAVVQQDFQTRLEAAGFLLPPGYRLVFGGESSKRNESVGNLMANVGVLMVLMVATLVLSFHSFRIASIVGVIALMSAGLGTGALWLFGYPFGFMAIVGTMGLIGVAINDAIVVLAAIREDPLAAAGDRIAVENVVVRASRHVIATTLTTIAGFVPLLVSGGGMWPPLAITIAGGVGGATILALYFAPSAYMMLMSPKQQSLAEKESVPAIVTA